MQKEKFNMKREITIELYTWLGKNKKRKPLIISGARQIGKSFIIKQFGNEAYGKNFLEINFEKNKNIHSIFNKDLEAKRIISELEILYDLNINDGSTLIFFDEIQACPDAIMALRYFYEEAQQVPIIAAGSLLDFQFREIPFPVGRVEIINMYPMTFKEFLLGMGKEKMIEHIEKDLIENNSIIEQQIYELLQTYFWVGGMPECVLEYIENQNLKTVQEIQENLLYSFQADFSKYKPKVETDCLTEIISKIPINIGKQVMYAKLSEKYSSPTVKKGVDVLRTSKIITKITNVSAEGLPLTESGRQFKLLFLDIGLLTKLSGLSLIDKITKSSLLPLFNGMMAEQFCGQELLAKKNNKVHYWSRIDPGTTSEVDYLIEENGKIIPIEIKSGKKGQLKSLHFMLEKYGNIAQARVYSMAESGKIDKIDFVPIYKIGF